MTTGPAASRGQAFFFFSVSFCQALPSSPFIVCGIVPARKYHEPTSTNFLNDKGRESEDAKLISANTS